MESSTYCILVLILFFTLLIHALYVEEKRTSDRRRRPQPVALERRVSERRVKQSWFGRLAWALQSRWTRKKNQVTPHT